MLTMCALGVGLVGGVLMGSASPAGARAAVVVPCEFTPAGPTTDGVLLFVNTSGRAGGMLLGNCFQHVDAGTVGPASGNAVVTPCDDLEDFEVFQGYMAGTSVVTPTGDSHTTCHPHLNPGTTPGPA